MEGTSHPGVLPSSAFAVYSQSTDVGLYRMTFTVEWPDQTTETNEIEFPMAELTADSELMVTLQSLLPPGLTEPQKIQKIEEEVLGQQIDMMWLWTGGAPGQPPGAGGGGAASAEPQRPVIAPTLTRTHTHTAKHTHPAPTRQPRVDTPSAGFVGLRRMRPPVRRWAGRRRRIHGPPGASEAGARETVPHRGGRAGASAQVERVRGRRGGPQDLRVLQSDAGATPTRDPPCRPLPPLHSAPCRGRLTPCVRRY